MTTLESLQHKTYALQHNPNCRNPYLIRLVGPGQGSLDLNQDYPKTKDVLCFGSTLEEAVSVALASGNKL
jgi:hypothetical protein